MLGPLMEQFRAWGGVRGLSSNAMVRSTVLLYVVQFSSYLFPLITLPFLSRVLQPASFGQVVYAQAFIWYFITLSDYGFGLTATRKIAAHRDDPAEVSRIFSAVMTAKLGLMALGFILMEAIVFATPKLRPDAMLFTVTYLNVLGNVIFPLWFFQGMQRLEQVAIRDFLSKFLAMVLLFWLIRDQGDYIWAAGIQSGGGFLAGIVGITQVRKVLPIKWRVPGWNEIRQELVDGWPVFLSMAALAATGSTNIFVLGLWATDAEVGYFSTAFRVVVAVRMLVTPLVSVLYPHLSHMVTHNRARVGLFLRREGLLLTAPFALISAVLFLTAHWLVPLAFGDKYGPTVPLLQILALSPFLLALSHNYTSYYMLPFGYDKQWSQFVVWGAALNYVVLFPLLLTIPATYAAAITTILVDVYSAGIGMWFYWRTRHATLGTSASGSAASSPVEP